MSRLDDLRQAELARRRLHRALFWLVVGLAFVVWFSARADARGRLLFGVLCVAFGVQLVLTVEAFRAVRRSRSDA